MSDKSGAGLCTSGLSFVLELPPAFATDVVTLQACELHAVGALEDTALLIQSAVRLAP